MGGILDFLTQGQPSAIPTGSDTSTVGPLWLQQYLQGVMGGAAATAGQPYNPFPGPTVAAPSAQTQQAWNLAGTNVGQWQPNVEEAGALTRGMAAPITAGDVSTFINPYQNYITGALNRNLNENLLPSIQDKFVSAGQSRSPQEAELTSRALRDTQTAVGESLAGGYQGALNSLMAERQQQGAAAGQLGNLGALGQRLGVTDVGQLAGAGGAQDVLAQQNLDAARAEFMRQQQWPQQQLGFMSDIAHGLPVGPSTTGATGQTVGMSSTGAFSPSPLNAFLGAVQGAQKLGLRGGGRVIGKRYVLGQPYRMGALSRRLGMAA